MKGYKFVIRTQSCIGRFSPKFSAAQRYLDNQVLKDSDQYVPMRTGNLRNSGITGTRIGSGIVVYNAPYARRMYYGRKFNFSKVKHPNACAFWFEKAKATKKSEWVKEVNSYVRR